MMNPRYTYISQVRHTRAGMRYVVTCEDTGEVWTFNSAVQGNAEFPGAFDVPDSDEDQQ